MLTEIAHFRADGTTQTIREHCQNVAEIAERNAMAFSIPLQSTARLLGLLHDMGKYSPAFQTYIGTALHEQKKGREVQPQKRPDHGKYGAMYLYRMLHTKQSSPFEKLTAEVLSFVICCHHGGLQDTTDLSDSQYRSHFVRRISEPDEAYATVQERYFEAMERETVVSLIPKAVAEIQVFCQKRPTGFQVGLLVKWLYSCLIDADRLDSAEYECGKPLAERVTPQARQKQFTLFAAQLEQNIATFSLSEDATDSEKTVFRERQKISDACLNASKQTMGIYRLTVPTGGGKTLSGMRFALNHVLQHQLRRIIYVAPYTTIIEQNAADVRDALDCGTALLEHHSNILQANETQNEHETDDGQTQPHNLLTERWDSPIIFTTMVQFLESVYGKSSRYLRKLNAMAGSVLIFDEVQTVPVKCLVLFNRAVNFLAKYMRCTVVLCTATQPTLGDLGKDRILFSEPAELVPNPALLFQTLKRNSIRDHRQKMPMQAEDVVGLAEEILNESENLLLIFNTKSAVKTVYQAMQERFGASYQVVYLTTLLCPAHRKKAIAHLRMQLKRHEKIICVCTRLIEAGVNISFQTVVRNLAGLDSIAQASGRGNRHGEREMGYTYVINYDEPINWSDELNTGVTVSQELLHTYQQQPERYENDLLSATAIRTYFQRYFQEGKIRNKAKYPLAHNTLCDLLDTNRERQKKSKLTITPQFREAEDHFNVIEESGQSVLIPWGEGASCITTLCSSAELPEKISALRRAQMYSVNLYDNERRALEEVGALEHRTVGAEGVLILKDAYYREDVGITTEPTGSCLML